MCTNPAKLLHGGLAENPPGHNRNLIAYLRHEPGGLTVEEQAKLIGEFCLDRGNKIVLTIVEAGEHAESIEKVMEALANADGVIVTDLNRLVANQEERAHELRVILHEFMCLGVHKRLISVREGIDTGTPTGQRVVLEVINQLKDAGVGI